MAPLFFWEGVVSRAGQVPIDEHSRGRLERAMPAMVGWVRWLVVGGGRGRWSVRGGVPTLERGNDPAWERSLSECSAARWKAGPAGRVVRGRTGLRGRKQPFGAEPVGGVRNREKGASCLSAASSCPAGSAARRPGSSQRQGCPFFWFFSLGRQRKERHPAGGRWHFGGAGGWEDQADRL